MSNSVKDKIHGKKTQLCEGESEYIELDLERRLASCVCICCGKLKTAAHPSPVKRKEQAKREKAEKITEPPAQVTKEQEQSGDNK